MICSFRVNEIRLDELLAEAGDAEEFDVLVLDESGNESCVRLKYTEKFGATSWRKELQCQRCGGPARVLRIAHGLARCRQCFPVPTQHHRHKNATHWKEEGALADSIVRSISKSESTKKVRRARQRLAARLTRNALSNASRVIEQATRFVYMVDNLPR